MFAYTRRTLSIIAIFGWGCNCVQAEVYKWVDERGRIYYSDSRPDSQKTPLVVDVSSPQVVSMKTTRNNPAVVETQVASSQIATESSSNESNNKSNNRADDARTRRDRAVAADPIRDPQCKAEWDRYDVSRRCFEPFRLANGGVKPEAYKRCQEIKEPTCH